MRRHLIGLAAAVGVLLSAGAGVAAADTGTQAVGQTAATGQSATSGATSTQTNPSNSNVDVRIFSPGNNGSVSQENSSTAASAALNAAETAQQASQQAGGGSASGLQAVGQQAGTGQSAQSHATSTQSNPSNSNISVRIGSPGNDGDVKQSNSSKALSLAANAAAQEQAVDQSHAGGGSGSGGGVQAVGQDAGTKQNANSSARSEQSHPSNENIPVRIQSPGNNGSVHQSNDSTAASAAVNLAETVQHTTQSSGGSGSGVQAVGQKAWTGQQAASDARSVQSGAKNTNAPLRLYSGGSDGSVSQSNSSTALSAAVNLAATFQDADQRQSGGGKDLSKGVQAIGQLAWTGQSARSTATSAQYNPANSNIPLRLYSGGGGGSVDQSNDSLAKSLGLNLAFTGQAVRQQQ